MLCGLPVYVYRPFFFAVKFNSLNSDDPVAPDGDLLPYVKANESCSILRGQQKFYSLVGGGDFNAVNEVNRSYILAGTNFMIFSMLF